MLVAQLSDVDFVLHNLRPLVYLLGLSIVTRYRQLVKIDSPSLERLQ